MFAFIKKAALTLSLAFAGAVGIDIGARQALCERKPLHPTYEKMAQDVFGDTLRLKEAFSTTCKPSFLTKDSTSIVIGNTLYNSDSAGTDFGMAHELAHIWQNQNDIPDTGVTGAIRLWFRMLPEPYSTAYTYKAEPGKAITDYNMEQQAEIFGDYYHMHERRKKYHVSPPFSDEERAVKDIVERVIPRPPLAS